MKLLAVTCDHCGAPLEVPVRTRYVTCAYCDTRLQVHQTRSAAYTEVLETVARRTEEIADRVERIELQNQLERLDREWTMHREQYMTRGKDGRLSVPNRFAGVAIAVFAGGFGLFWTISAGHAGAPRPFSLFGLLFVIFAVISGIVVFNQAGAYQQHKTAYERERRRLVRKLNTGPLLPDDCDN